MLKILLSMAISQAASQHGIYSGFNLVWVMPFGGIGQVALTVGAASVDGFLVTNAPAGFPPASYFPNDSPPITPVFEAGIVPVVGEEYVAYCYVQYTFGLAAAKPAPPWFAGTNDAYFMCIVGSDYRPTPDGHPTNWLPYVEPAGTVYLPTALFVGSIIGIEVAYGSFPNGNPAGFSVLPFYRNGSQVIYPTNTASGSVMNANWDVGIPTMNWATGMPDPIHLGSLGLLTPGVQALDFTDDGVNDVLPLSASEIILDTEAYAHIGTDTLCFLDPNQAAPAFPNLNRSCESEQQLDADFGGLPGGYAPVSPFRTHVNIGQSTAGRGYGEVSVAGTCSPSPMGKIYIDFAYRGYVEPERQLVSQLPVP